MFVSRTDQGAGCAGELRRGLTCRTEIPAEKKISKPAQLWDVDLTDLDTAGRHVDGLLVVVVGGGQRLLLVVRPGLAVQ